SDCTLVKAATDAERIDLLRRVAQQCSGQTRGYRAAESVSAFDARNTAAQAADTNTGAARAEGARSDDDARNSTTSSGKVWDRRPDEGDAQSPPREPSPQVAAAPASTADAAAPDVTHPAYQDELRARRAQSPAWTYPSTPPPGAMPACVL